MGNIDNEIQKLIRKLRKEYKIPGYAYNDFSNFIPGVTPVYYSGPYFTDDELVSATKALLIGKWASAGENVRAFEKAFSRKTKNLFSVMTNSGSSANLVMIASLKKYFKWNDGDEIIVSVVGFPTTISVIPQNNLTPVFVDIEMETLNFDIDKIQEKITDRTQAIFVSPVLGNPPDFDKIIDICMKYNLILILDNCDSLGSKWNKKYLNEYADASSCSFYPAHEITTFEGGMVSTNLRGIINEAKSIVSWGRDCICEATDNLLPNGVCNHRFDRWLEDYDGIIDHKYVFTNMGYNLKPVDILGAIGLVQLKKLDEICKLRTSNYSSLYCSFYNNISGIKIPESLPKADTVWFGFPVICESKEQKQTLVKHLEDNKIQTRNYFAGNILIHPAYKHLGNFKEYSNANQVLDKVFFVGVNPAYTVEVLVYIEEILGEFKWQS